MKPQWIRISGYLWVSQDRRYLLSYWIGFWYVAYFDGAGWSLLGSRPADSILEAKMRCNRHRFTRPLETKASA